MIKDKSRLSATGNPQAEVLANKLKEAVFVLPSAGIRVRHAKGVSRVEFIVKGKTERSFTFLWDKKISKETVDIAVDMIRDIVE